MTRPRRAAPPDYAGLLALVAHDLRAPLLTLDASLALLLDDRARYGPLRPAQQRVLRRARRGASFLRQLIDETVDVGRAEAGRVKPERTTLERVLLDALPPCLASAQAGALDEVRDPDDFAEVRAALARCEVTIEAAPALLRAPATTDRMWLARILMNLVSNAARHAPGPLRVCARRAPGRRLEVAVEDRGPGIPAPLRAAVFDPFRQLEAKEAGAARGFGLGLTGARRLAEALGGTIRAEAAERGQGARFVVTIPWGDAPAAGIPRGGRAGRPATRAAAATRLTIRQSQ